MEQVKEQRLYQPKEVVELTGINKETLVKYTTHFNIQTEWTQPNNKGHRRYTQENIELLKAIKSKIHKDGWSWKQVTSWLNGEEDLFIKKEEKSTLEKKQDLMLEEIKMLREHQEKQEKLFQLIIERMEENHQAEMSKKENDRLKLENYINNSLNERDRALNKPRDEKKGFFSKLFSN